MLARSVVIASAGVVLFALLAGATPCTAAIRVGEKAPDFLLQDLDGGYHSVSGYGSYPLVLMFLECDRSVSTSTAPLVQTDIADRYRDQKVMVFGLECSGCGYNELSNFRDQTGVDFPLLLNAGSTQDVYDVPIDSFVLIDGTGTVRYISPGPGVGAYDSNALRTAIDQVLREANNTKAATWGLIKSLYQ